LLSDITETITKELKMGVLGRYKNGNYFVTILNDGTKIRHNDSDSFNPEKPESMDLKITNQCDMGCLMCHENSTPDGKHGNILNMQFIDTLLPYTEIAIGGGNPLSHPDLIQFLEQLKERKLIANVTVNQTHFMKDVGLIRELVDKKLIYGLGVSLVDANDEFVNAVSEFPNAVVHVINGIITMDELHFIAHKNIKILILGYKEFRRGKSLYERQNVEIDHLKSAFYDILPKVIDEEWFDVVSFDNLAIKQLNPKRLMDDDKWNEFYMGDDGSFTMYVDAVNQEFAKSSTSTERWKLDNDIKNMFDKVREVQ